MKLVSALTCFILLNNLKIGEPWQLSGPVYDILRISWNNLNPAKIKDISEDLVDIKTHLDKLEHTVTFGWDIKTVEHLIETYIDVQLQDKSTQEKWADTALEYGSDGFDKSLKSLKEIMDGSSQIFAEDSILAVIGNQNTEFVSYTASKKYLPGRWPPLCMM